MRPRATIWREVGPLRFIASRNGFDLEVAECKDGTLARASSHLLHRWEWMSWGHEQSNAIELAKSWAERCADRLALERRSA